MAAARLIRDLPTDLAQFLSSLADALIIAGLVALLVDPLAQHQFATEWGRDLFWAIFSPDAPEQFRNALQSLAAPAGYIQRCTWVLSFERSGRIPDVLDMDVQIAVEGVNLNRHGFRPTDVVYCVAREDGSPSTYAEWSFRGEGVEPAQYTETEMKALGALTVEATGRVMLNQNLLPEPRQKIPFRKTYVAERRMITSRRISDHYPLFLNRMALEQIVIIRGDVIADLDFGVVQLGGENMLGIVVDRPDGRIELHYSTTNVTFPHQGSMVEWRQKAPSRDRSTAGLPSAEGTDWRHAQTRTP